jgi:DNA-binding ferritin-like protein (Dps family)
MNDSKYIVMDVRGSLHRDSDYITQIMDITGKIKKTRDIFKILPFIMEKAEIIKKTKSNISSEECKLLTIQILKKMVEMSDNSEKNEHELLSFVDHNVGEFIQVLVKASKNEYEFNKRYTMFQRIFNWIMFSRLMSIFKTGAEIALL